MLQQEVVLTEDLKNLIRRYMNGKYKDKLFLSQTENQIMIKREMVSLLEYLVPKVFEEGLARHN